MLPDAVARPAGEGRPQPLRPLATRTCPGRCPTSRAEVARRARRGRPRRRCVRRRWPQARPGQTDRRHGGAGPDRRSGTTSWTRLVEEASRDRSPVIDVPLPSSLSATGLARLRDAPDSFAADLARPMPRQPSPAARFGTRFHAWVESRFGQQDLFDPDDLPGRGDAGIDDDADLAGPDRHLRVRAVRRPRRPTLSRRRSRWCSRGQVVRGRIDAVYAEPGPTATGGSWSTGRPTGPRTADPWQLALYRLAWAELAGRAAGAGDARSSTSCAPATVVEPADLPGRAELETVFAPR